MDHSFDDRDNDGGIEWWQTVGQQQEHHMRLSGQDFKPRAEPIQSGTHTARLVQLVDFGTQEDSYQGEKKVLKKIRLVWELPGELDEEGKPRMLGKTYTASMGEMATLRKHFESWRGKNYSQQELKDFNITSALGQPCTLTVVNRSNEETGKVVAQINGVSPPMKGVPIPEQVSKKVFFSLEQYSQEVFDSLPEWQQTLISKSPEFKKVAASNVQMLPMLEDEDVPF
jgi:hypothetical protein